MHEMTPTHAPDEGSLTEMWPGLLDQCDRLENLLATDPALEVRRQTIGALHSLLTILNRNVYYMTPQELERRRAVDAALQQRCHELLGKKPEAAAKPKLPAFRAGAEEREGEMPAAA